MSIDNLMYTVHQREIYAYAREKRCQTTGLPNCLRDRLDTDLSKPAVGKSSVTYLIASIVFSIQRMLRYSNFNMTRRYVHFRQSYISAQHSISSPLNNIIQRNIRMDNVLR